MKCEKHNVGMKQEGRVGFGQEGRWVCPKCLEEIEALRAKIQVTDNRPPENHGRRRNGW